MGGPGPSRAAVAGVPTPCYLVEEALLERNLRILAEVRRRSGASILLALKGFAMFSVFPLVRRYLDGICASGPFEARLGRERFGKEVHVFSPAYSDADMRAVLRIADHVVFNSWGQWQRFRPLIARSRRAVECGLRINPGYSEVQVPLYDPCAPGSRLGVRAEDLAGRDLAGLAGLHFHAMCEQNSDTLERILDAVERRFGRFIKGMKWVNFGGGHHITREDYDVDLLCRLVTSFAKRYGVKVYLEPGEAIALNAGFLVASVLDIVHNEMDIAILDTSTEAHMPDVLAMPYRPEVAGAGLPGELRHTYRLAGNTCLAGDVIGDYSFAKPLKVGSRVVFLDMAHYTMVKNTTFNGIPLPAIALLTKRGKVRVVKRFGYEDYEGRLS